LLIGMLIQRSMTATVNDDDLLVMGKIGEVLAERIYTTAIAVNHQQRLSLVIHFVTEPDSPDGLVMANGWIIGVRHLLCVGNQTCGKYGRNYVQIAEQLNGAGFRTARGFQFQATQVMRPIKRQVIRPETC
jgi:hypothetical protein